MTSHHLNRTSRCSTRTGERRTTSPSARSTCSTTRCCASRCGPSTSSPGCSGTGARRPGLNLIYAHLNRAIRDCGPGRDVRHRARSRRPGHRRQRVPRGHVQRGLPGGEPRRGRPAPPVPAVLVPRRHPQPRGARDARARSTRAASWATRSRTPTAPRSTTPGCSSCCVVGDGEAETGPLATSWHSNKFLDPARDGAVLPILHLNGYKIANPTLLARIPEDELATLFEGHGYRVALRRRRRPRWPCTASSRPCSTRSCARSTTSRAGPAADARTAGRSRIRRRPPCAGR